MFRVSGVWIVIFGIWFLWESTLLVFLRHADWSLASSLNFLLLNLAYGVFWSFIFAAIHGLVSKIFPARKIPVAGVAVSLLAIVPVLLFYRMFAIQKQISMPMRWVTATVMIAAIFGTFIVAANRTTRIFRNRPGSIKWTILVLALIPVATLFARPVFRKQLQEQAAGPIRHVVLISIDTLRYDYVGAYGLQKVSTPVMDKVAKEGVLFEHCISHIPHTGPSHTSMFTGKAPLSHGIRFNGQPLEGQTAPFTLTQKLRHAGFRTGGFVSGIPMKAMYSGLNRGFEVYQDNLAWGDLFSETSFGRMWNAIPFHTRCLRRSASEVMEPALEWLGKNSTQPFFLFLHFYDPHYPYGSKAAADPVNPWQITAGPNDLEEQKRLYADQVEAVDLQIGRLIRFLEERKIYDETLLVITSDHGESLGEHNYYYGHDHFVYEELLRVPFMIRCPRLVKPGIRITEQVALRDIYKTILDGVGLKPDRGTEGQTLLKIASGAELPQRDGILSHNFVAEVHSLRMSSVKLIRNDKRPREPYELYDLIHDPKESRNLYSVEKVKAEQLRKRMALYFNSGDTSSPGWKKEDLTPEQIEDLKSLGYIN